MNLEEIETDTNAVDANQVYDVGDVIDIAIEGRIFFFGLTRTELIPITPPRAPTILICSSLMLRSMS